jgi:uridine phosphorylase
VELFRPYFDQIWHEGQHREYFTLSGMCGKFPLSVMSTGMGTGNIEIAMLELDFLSRYDLSNSTEKDFKAKTILRLGTCGALQTEIDLGSLVNTQIGVSYDGLLQWYQDRPHCPADLARDLNQSFSDLPVPPIAASASQELVENLGAICQNGMTATCIGFYAAQGRQIQLRARHPDLLDRFQGFRSGDHRFLNFEMESAVIIGLGNLLGHRCASVSTVLANRQLGTFHKDPAQAVSDMIDKIMGDIESILS